MKKIVYALLFMFMMANLTACVVQTRAPHRRWERGHYNVGPHGARYWVPGHYNR